MPSPYNLDVTLDKAWENLLHKNMAEVAATKGATLDEGNYLLLPFLNEVFRINCLQKSISSDCTGTVDTRLQVLALHYLASPAVSLKGKWISFKELPGGAIYQQPFYRRTVSPLIAAFSQQPASLMQTAQYLAGKPIDMGDAAIELYPFPFLVMRLIIWTGDEELSPGGTILFDASAAHMLATEDYTILSEYVVQRLIFLKKQG